MCVEGMGCVRRLVIRVLLRTGTASWRPEVPWWTSLTMRCLSRPAVNSKTELHERWRRVGNSGYNMSVVGTYRSGRLALCGVDVWRWTPWGTPENHGWSLLHTQVDLVTYLEYYWISSAWPNRTRGAFTLKADGLAEICPVYAFTYLIILLKGNSISFFQKSVAWSYWRHFIRRH